MIDPFSRKQPDFTMQEMFSDKKGECACGCGLKLTGRKKRWGSKKCSNNAYHLYSIIKGDTRAIRRGLKIRDKSICKHCNKKTEKWDADHIIPVYAGGGGCTLDNFQTLCRPCHVIKTRKDMEKYHNEDYSEIKSLLKIYTNGHCPNCARLGEVLDSKGMENVFVLYIDSPAVVDYMENEESSGGGYVFPIIASTEGIKDWTEIPGESVLEKAEWVYKDTLQARKS